jgi:hypothetical protein
MASKKKAAAKVGGKAAKRKAENAADTARPYVQRLIEDEELRENIRGAYEAGRDAYSRASGAKGPGDLLDDKKLQKDLREATDALRAASETLRHPEKKQKSGGLGKVVLVLIVGAILAVALSEDLRKTLLDQLFGAEEEFEYTSSTSSPAGNESASSS